MSKNNMLRILPALALLIFMSWAVVQADTGSSSIFLDIVQFLPYGDKVGHFFLYGLLALLTVIACNYKCVQVKGYQVPLGAIIVLSLAIIEEITQIFMINRTFDLVDVLADIAGVCCFIFILNKYRATRVNSVKQSALSS